MNALQDFQLAARERGFVDVQGDEYGADNVLWLRKEIANAKTKTHQRLCLDSMLKSATIYWMNLVGTIESKTFHTVTSLKEWLALHTAG